MTPKQKVHKLRLDAEKAPGRVKFRVRWRHVLLIEEQIRLGRAPNCTRLAKELEVNPDTWPPCPKEFGVLLTPLEAAMRLRLHETGRHTPASAIRTLDYFRNGVNFARRSSPGKSGTCGLNSTNS